MSARAPERAAAHAGADHPVGGIVCLCVGLMFFSGQDAIFKLLSGDYSVLQLLAFRSSTAVALLGGYVLWRHGPTGVLTRQGRLHLLRCAFLLLAFLSFYTGVSLIPLADVVALFGAAPLFITALAGPVLGERVGVRRWSAVIVGFAGVVVMLRPGSAVFQADALLGLLAAFGYSGSALAARRLGRAERTEVLALYSNLSFLIACSAGLVLVTAFVPAPAPGVPISPIARPFVAPGGLDLALMLGAGVIAMGGFMLVPRAYQIAPASVVAPFEYTYLLWAMLIGLVGFGEVPSASTLAGAALVVGAGIYIARREAALRRAARRTLAPEIPSPDGR